MGFPAAIVTELRRIRDGAGRFDFVAVVRARSYALARYRPNAPVRSGGWSALRSRRDFGVLSRDPLLCELLPDMQLGWICREQSAAVSSWWSELSSGR